MMRLEHPRCSVMVEVLDQYTQIQRRLEPYLARYYQAMANDPVYNDWVSNLETLEALIHRKIYYDTTVKLDLPISL